MGYLKKLLQDEGFLDFLIVFQLVEMVQPYESPHEEQFYCKRNGVSTKPKETILVLSPHDEYFFKKLGLSQPSGKCDFKSISFVVFAFTK